MGQHGKQEEKAMKKRAWISGAIALAMLTLALLFAGNKAQAANLAQGICGDNLEWTLSTTGKLTITGTGDMTNWSSENVPWYNYRDRISSLSIQDGVTSIGDRAFRNCTSLREVKLPNSVTRIGAYSFYCCDLIRVEALGVISLGDCAFRAADNDIEPLVFVFSALRTHDNSFIDYYSSYTSILATVYYYGTSEELNQLGSFGQKVSSYAIPYPKITAQPQNKTVETGTTANFSVSATGRSLSYLWQYSKDGGKTWGTWDRKDSINVKATGDRNGYKFRCQVTDVAGTVITSKVVTFKETFGISVNPTSQSVYAKENAVFTVKAGGSGLSYNWQYSKDNGKTWSLWSRAREITVPAEGHRNGFLFRCTVSDNAGNSKTTKAVKLTVLTKITAQPKSVSAAKGETVKFTVKAEGPKLSYKWQFSKDGGKTWASWGTGNSISVVAAAGRNNYRFRCLITDANGKTTTSKAVTLTIK